MEAIKVIFNGIEYILPIENEGMCTVRGLETERVEVSEITNIMEDLINAL